MREPVSTGRSDTPATALGPTAVVLGALSTVGALAPALTFVLFPWSILAGGLALTFGASGIHYARHGVGRLWTAVLGTALGGIGFGGVLSLFLAFSV